METDDSNLKVDSAKELCPVCDEKTDNSIEINRTPSKSNKKEVENKILQNCGDFLIIEGKSTKKVRNRYYYVGHFEGYSRKLYFRLDTAKYGNVSNPNKKDEYGFICDESNVDKYIYNIWKNMERRCYDPKCPAYSTYGAKGITVSEEFKTYSNFRKWYEENGDGSHNLELDKDCKSYILNVPKIYSPSTCILIPSEINTFISTIGKGIYITPSNTYCVRLRRKFAKINKNFKTLEEAVIYKKNKDMEYLNILVEKHPLPVDNFNIVKRYVEIFKYPSNI